METFEYGILYLSWESEEIEIDEEYKKLLFEYIQERRYSPEWVNGIQRYRVKEVLIAKSFDASGIEKEILKEYTGFSYSESLHVPERDGARRIVLTNRPKYLNSSVGLTILIASSLSKLGSEGWNAIDYKVSDENLGFAQALLKRRITK